MIILKYHLTKVLLIIILFSFYITNAKSENSYYKCPERITEVRVSNDLYKKDYLIGNNFIKLNKSGNKTLISIFFEPSKTNEKSTEIIKNKKIKTNSLGFDFSNNIETATNRKENYYNFIKISNTYAFTKKEFFWSAKDSYKDEEIRDYDSAGRCIQLKQFEYNNFLNNNEASKSISDTKKIKKQISYDWMAISTHPKSSNNFTATELSTKKKAVDLAMSKCYEFVSNNLGNKGYQQCSLVKVVNTNDKTKNIENSTNEKTVKKNNKSNNKRTFALFWSGYDDLIIGTLSFIEDNLVGRVEFELPDDEASCFGTYVLSKTKGTWSFLCDNDKNASGFLKWNSSNGNISGEGKDMLGNEVKIKIAGE